MDEETLSELEQIAKTLNRLALELIDIQIDLQRIHKLLRQAGIERATKGDLGIASAEKQEGVGYTPAEG